ncbi:MULTISPECIES: hypothetical protein [Muribaculaceae]|uniref:hypothetical protein n=1 Tax=Muribaculaceae TaxID=2005473 RepID=UPI00264A08D7|nr:MULTISPECIES: hypothetical protein [Muribaculaceae]
MKSNHVSKRLCSIFAAFVMVCLPAVSVDSSNHMAELPQASAMVYICTGPKAKVYHSTSKCKGLKKCSGSVKKITKAEAQKIGRRACKVCY